MLWIVAAPGPSLNDEIVRQCRGYNAIAVNDAYRLMPWADVLYAADVAWWRARNGCQDFKGEKLTTVGRGIASAVSQFGLSVIQSRRFERGFSFTPGVIHLGQANGGFQAINVALLRGANPVVMVGFDMHGTHFFGDHEPPLKSYDRQKQQRIFARWIEGFRIASQQLPPDIRIINATPGSAITCFPIMTLQEALYAEHGQYEVEDIHREADGYPG